MKILPLLGAGFMLCAMTPAGAAYNDTLDGGTGLVVMRTADTLQRGRLDVSTLAWGQEGRYINDDFAWDALVMPEVSFGVFNNLEIGLGAPYQYNIENDTSGLRLVHGQIKFRFFNFPNQGISAAVTAYGGLLPSKHQDLASGANNYGAELEISMPRLLKPLGTFHLSLGFEKSDTKIATVPVSYQRQIKKRLNMGVEVPLDKKWNASLEVLFVRADNVNDTVMLVPGLRYTVSDSMTLLMAAGWGSPKKIARPELRLLGGISYVFDAARRAPVESGHAATTGDDESRPTPDSGEPAPAPAAHDPAARSPAPR